MKVKVSLSLVAPTLFTKFIKNSTFKISESVENFMNRVHFFGRIQVEIFDLRSFGGVM